MQFWLRLGGLVLICLVFDLSGFVCGEMPWENITRCSGLQFLGVGFSVGLRRIWSRLGRSILGSRVWSIVLFRCSFGRHILFGFPLGDLSLLPFYCISCY